MARVTIEDCMKRMNSRFALVHLAVRRVLQLRNGAKPMIDAPKNKEIVVALREIAAGKVTLDNIDALEQEQVLGLIDSAPATAVDEEALKKQQEIKEAFDEAASRVSNAMEDSDSDNLNE
ncbi:MAG: DNA-directed RNA polymerase subunit omega [Deltaproteobacteria bacterium]|nr:DNA-directed RNA polymerase subunit omega [Deltaproteobacteria bacterium]MBW2068070.1 DNA-directed RNA polymerase subunit omega [Deltaproteobacteria bacterium]